MTECGLRQRRRVSILLAILLTLVSLGVADAHPLSEHHLPGFLSGRLRAADDVPITAHLRDSSSSSAAIDLRGRFGSTGDQLPAQTPTFRAGKPPATDDHLFHMRYHSPARPARHRRPSPIPPIGLEDGVEFLLRSDLGFTPDPLS